MRGVNEGSGVKGMVPVCIAEPGGERSHLAGTVSMNRDGGQKKICEDDT